MKAFDEEIVSGSIFHSVWKLAWPVILLNLVNGVHSLVDHILVGHYVQSGNNAGNAAIGVSWQVFLVLVVFIASIFHGMNVLIARYSGRQDRDNVSRVFYDAFLAAVGILALMAPVGYVAAPYLLKIVADEPEVIEQALPYLRILFVCGSPLFLMFMMTGAFQASGDPKTPLKLGILGTIVNVAVSAVLVPGLGPFPALGTTGAAIGTCAGPLVGVLLGLSLIMRKRMIIQPPSRMHWKPNLKILRTIASIGFPTGIQGVLLNVGGMALLWFISKTPNSAAALAAYVLCYTQIFSIITWPSFGLRAAASTVMGQNIGAGNPPRGKRGVALAAGMGCIWAGAIGSIFWLAPHYLLALFSADEGLTYEYAQTLLIYLSFSGVALASTLALTGGIQGAGETKLPMYIAAFTQIGVLLGFCYVLYTLGALTTERIWMAILISHTSRLVLTAALFRTEKWAHKRVELHD